MFEVVADEEVAALIYLGYNCSMQGNVVDTLEDVEGWEGGGSSCGIILVCKFYVHPPGGCARTELYC